jgi:phosphatidylinositol glycan class N
MGTITSVRSYICCLPAIYLFVLSFTDRWLISIELVLVGIAPHLLEDDSKSRQLRLVWTLNAGALAIFPLLPTVGQTPVTWLAIAAPAIVALLLLIGVSTIRNREYMHYMPYRIAIVWLIVCSVIIGVVTIAVDSGAGSPLICRMLAWCSLVAAPLLAICTESTSAEVRLVHWTLALFIPYSLLSISYESIFFALFSIQLYLYLRMELSSTVSLLSTDIRLLATNGSNSTSNSTEWRRALMLVLFTLVAFFGTGNVASLNSFNPSFLRAFITVFSPETMAALLVFKIIVPLVSVAIAFVVLASIGSGKSFF